MDEDGNKKKKKKKVKESITQMMMKAELKTADAEEEKERKKKEKQEKIAAAAAEREKKQKQKRVLTTNDRLLDDKVSISVDIFPYNHFSYLTNIYSGAAELGAQLRTQFLAPMNQVTQPPILAYVVLAHPV